MADNQQPNNNGNNSRSERILIKRQTVTFAIMKRMAIPEISQSSGIRQGESISIKFSRKVDLYWLLTCQPQFST